MTTQMPENETATAENISPYFSAVILMKWNSRKHYIVPIQPTHKNFKHYPFTNASF